MGGSFGIQSESINSFSDEIGDNEFDEGVPTVFEKTESEVNLEEEDKEETIC